MGEASVELTTDQIRSMSTSEVDNCMDMVGNLEKWSDDQYQAWAEKFLQVRNLQSSGSFKTPQIISLQHIKLFKALPI